MRLTKGNQLQQLYNKERPMQEFCMISRGCSKPAWWKFQMKSPDWLIKDFQNIKVSFSLESVKRHSEDQVSVQACIDEWAENEEGNPVLFYKFQGQECRSNLNFAKVIQNPYQKEIPQMFAHKGICVDSTHGTTGYDFLLTSLVCIGWIWWRHPSSMVAFQPWRIHMLHVQFFQTIVKKNG